MLTFYYCLFIYEGLWRLTLQSFICNELFICHIWYQKKHIFKYLIRACMLNPQVLMVWYCVCYQWLSIPESQHTGFPFTLASVVMLHEVNPFTFLISLLWFHCALKYFISPLTISCIWYCYNYCTSIFSEFTRSKPLHNNGTSFKWKLYIS